MTGKEIIEYIVNECQNTRCKYLTKDNECVEDGNCFEVKSYIIKALEEIQQYRAIGTVDDIQKVLSFLSDENKRSIIDDLKLLNEYKDAEEQGLLHKAPLKNGTPIWYLLEGFDEGAYLTQSTYLYNVTEYEIGELGKKFWLSEKEAEQALAKMKEV